ncbi:MAG TPA: hypothetical protein VES19_11350 [Candidatus Limnocylindrales bacterium]|nr:hypothetical protein [Candidatus Limnocylindrales bacterium]
MHGTSHPKPAVKPATTGVNAVVWIEPGRAIVVRGGDGAELPAMEIAIPSIAAVTPPVLAEVAHTIGDVDRVLVLGVDELRTALEREIVAIGHRPETIRDAEVAGPMDVAALRERLALLR